MNLDRVGWATPLLGEISEGNLWRAAHISLHLAHHNDNLPVSLPDTNLCLWLFRVWLSKSPCGYLNLWRLVLYGDWEMMVMRNILFLGWKKETAFPELSLISTRAGTILCFTQVLANMWVVAGRLLYRVWGIAWSRLSISKAVLEFLWLTTDILWQHLTCNQVLKVDIFLSSSLSPYLNYHN